MENFNRVIKVHETRHKTKVKNKRKLKSKFFKDKGIEVRFTNKVTGTTYVTTRWSSVRNKDNGTETK